MIRSQVHRAVVLAAGILFLPWGNLAFAQCQLAIAPAKGIPESASWHSVRCGVFEVASEAAARARELEALGYAPVWLRELDGTTGVYVGRADYQPDAVWMRVSLREHGYDDAVRRIFREPFPKGEAPCMQMPDDPLVAPERAVYPATAAAVDMKGNPALSEFEQALTAGDFRAAIADGQAALESLDDADPVKGRVMLETAWGMVQAEGKTRPSLPDFLKVARGEVAATKEDQLRARFLAADSWHYYFFNPLQAQQAYKEILKAHAGDAGACARAQAEILACYLELARSEASTFDEVRRAAAQVQATVPREFERVHAVADLIACETWFYAGDYQKTLDELEQFALRHPDRPREQSMACLYMLQAAIKVRNWDLARLYNEKLQAMDLSDPDECFYWAGERWDLKKRAYDAMALYAPEFGEELTAPKASAEPAASGAGKTSPFDQAFPHGFYERTSD